MRIFLSKTSRKFKYIKMCLRRFFPFSLYHLIYLSRRNPSKVFLWSDVRCILQMQTRLYQMNVKSGKYNFANLKRLAMKIKHNFLCYRMMFFRFKIPLPLHVFSSSSSSRPSGQRQKIFFIVNRQICEQFPLLLAQSPASSQVRPSDDNFVFGRFSQEHSKLPQVLRQISWHSPRPLFLEHSFMSVWLRDFQQKGDGGKKKNFP